MRRFVLAVFLLRKAGLAEMADGRAPLEHPLIDRHQVDEHLALVFFVEEGPGVVVTERVRDMRADQPPIEAPRVVVDLDQRDIRQQRRNLHRVKVAARRHLYSVEFGAHVEIQLL